MAKRDRGWGGSHRNMSGHERSQLSKQRSVYGQWLSGERKGGKGAGLHGTRS